MAKQGLGQFAGAFANAFTNTMAASKDAKQKEELAKLQAKLVERQLAVGQSQLNAQTTLADIMTGSFVGKAESVGDKVPAQDGRKAVPDIRTGGESVSLVDLLSGENTLPPGIQSEGVNAAIQSGTISGGDMLKFQSEQNRLAKIPDIGSLFGSMQPDSAGNLPFIMGGLTLDPTRGPIQSYVPNPTYQTPTMLENTKLGFTSLVDEAWKAVDLVKQNTGSLVESGSPIASGARSAKSVFGTFAGALGFGKTEQEQRGDVGRKDEIGKIYAGIQTEFLKELYARDSNPPVVAIEQALAGAPGTDKNDEANMALIASFFEKKLGQAQASGIELSEATKEKYRTFIQQAKDGTLLGDRAQGTVVDVNKLAKSTIEEIKQIDPDSLKPEEFDAYVKRLRELAGASK